jgi:hypothetical protein
MITLGHAPKALWHGYGGSRRSSMGRGRRIQVAVVTQSLDRVAFIPPAD